jgi:hypothetical protein
MCGGGRVRSAHVICGYKYVLHIVVKTGGYLKHNRKNKNVIIPFTITKVVTTFFVINITIFYLL